MQLSSLCMRYQLHISWNVRQFSKIKGNFTYNSYMTYRKTVTKAIAYQPKRTRSCSTNCALLVTHQISLTKSQCSKQKQKLMCNISHPKFPCRICAKNVHGKDKAVQCGLCELWNHIKCINLNYLDYRYLQNCDESWY